MTDVTRGARQDPEAGPSPGLPGRLFGVILSPRATFAAVVDRPRPFGALLVVALCSAALNGWLLSTELGQQMLLEQQIASMESVGMTVTDETYTSMERGMRRMPYVAATSAFIVFPIVTLVLAGLVWTACYVIFGAHAPFKAMYAVVTHAGVVSIAQALFVTPLNYARGAMSNPATLAALLPMLDEGGFLHRTLAVVDLFIVWQLFLLAVGSGVLYKRRTGPFAATFYGLYAVVAIAAGFIMSRLGG